MYHHTSFHPLDFIGLVTEHKLIGAIIALALLVFIFSIAKIVGAVRAERKSRDSQD